MKVGVILSGCGVQDGSEIYEAVLTILALEKGGATVQALAPDVEQAEIVNHYTNDETRLESRSVLAESARIVRGKIMSASEISAHELDALILPGGYGAVKNLCTYATDGVEGTVNPDVERLITQMHALTKPIGALCIAPVVVALALKGKGLSLTVGSDAQTALHLEQLGAHHVPTDVREICVDARNRVISTAAFMLAHSASEAEPGIARLVEEVLRIARSNMAPVPDVTDTSHLSPAPNVDE